MKKLLIITSLLIVLSSCTFISNMFEYKSRTREFIEALILEDYDGAQLHMYGQELQNVNDSLKTGLMYFRGKVIDELGTDLDFSFSKAETKISTIESENTTEGCTDVLIEVSNGEYFDEFKIVFEDTTLKIVKITLVGNKRLVQQFSIGVWLFSIIPIGILVFNISVIRMIKRAQLKRKWLKYLAVFILNVPTFSYSVNGLSFNLLEMQMLCGFGFTYMGVEGFIWKAGIPLAGIYWYHKLKKDSQEINLIEDGDEAVIEK